MKKKKTVLAATFLLPLLLVPIINNCLYLFHSFLRVDYLTIKNETTLNLLLDDSTYIFKDNHFFRESDRIAESILEQHSEEVFYEDRLNATIQAQRQVSESGSFNFLPENYGHMLDSRLKPVNKFSGLKLILEKDSIDVVGALVLVSSKDVSNNQISSILLFEKDNDSYILIKKKTENGFQYCVLQQTESDGFGLNKLEEWYEQDLYLEIVDIDDYNEFSYRYFTIGTGKLSVIAHLIKLSYIIEYLILFTVLFMISKFVKAKTKN